MKLRLTSESTARSRLYDTPQLEERGALRWGSRSKPRRYREHERTAAYQPDAGDATAVSTVRGACSMGGFDGRRKLAEWAPCVRVVVTSIDPKIDGGRSDIR